MTAPSAKVRNGGTAAESTIWVSSSSVGGKAATNLEQSRVLQVSVTPAKGCLTRLTTRLFAFGSVRFFLSLHFPSSFCIQNLAGQLAAQDLISRQTPTLVSTGVFSTLWISSLDSRWSHALALGTSHAPLFSPFRPLADPAGYVYAWGDATYQQLLLGAANSRTTPTLVSPVLSSVSMEVAASGLGHSLLLGENFDSFIISERSVCVTDSSNVYSGGYNAFGQSGTGDISDRYTATLVQGDLSSQVVNNIFVGAVSSMATGWNSVHGSAHCPFQ